MLNHRNIVILFCIVLISLVTLDIQFHVHWIVYVLVFSLFLFVEIYGAASISAGFHVKALCKLDTSEKWLVLSFDDGPVANTEKVLAVLDDFEVKATFFCIGKRIKEKEHVLKSMDAKGHIIGNHSYTHSFLYDLKSTGSFINDIELASREIQRVIGKKPAFFRPPYGVTTPGLSRACNKLDLQVIGWSIRSLDTQKKDRQKLLSGIKKQLKPGSILLLHDTVSGIEVVVKELLIFLKENNYKVVALDQAIQKRAYA